MKVVIVNGSVRAGQTDRALALFEAKLRGCADLQVVRIDLRKMRLEGCRGCTVCLQWGESRCPHRDDLAAILADMDSADGVIFATPNYALQVSWVMKTFLDRLAFVFHRPRFYRKVSLSIVIEGVFGAKGIVKYLDEVASLWGFSVCEGARFTLPWGVYEPAKPWPKEAQERLEGEFEELATRFCKALERRMDVRPGWKQYLVFRAARTAHRNTPPADRACDYEHFRSRGWFESDFFCDSRVSLAKKCAGAIVERAIEKKMKREMADRAKEVKAR